MRDNKVFSIIIPTFNRAKLLPRAIGSALNQTYNNLEIVIVDDGSTDNTEGVVKSFCDNRIKYIKLETNKGVSAARNRGLDLAKGDFIIFLDSDDELLSDGVDTFYKIWHGIRDNKIGNVVTRCLDGYTGKKIGYMQQDEMVLEYIDIISNEKKIGEFRSCWKRAAIGDTRFEEDIISYERILWWRLAKRWSFFYKDLPTVIMYYQEGSLSSGNLDNLSNSLYAINIIVNEHGEALSKYHPVEYIALLNSYASRCLLAGNSQEARKTALNAIRQGKLSVLTIVLLTASILGKRTYIAIYSLAKSGVFLKLKAGFNRLKTKKRYLKWDSSLIKGRDHNSKTRILFYDSSSGYGGAGNALAGLVNNIDKDRYHPFVIIKSSGPQTDKIQNIEIRRIKDYKEPKNIGNPIAFLVYAKEILAEIFKIFFFIITKKIQIIHINTAIGIPKILAAKMAGIPCVCHMRHSRKLIKREKVISKLVTSFIVINKSAFSIFEDGIPKYKMRLVYDGIDLDEFNGLERGALRQPLNLNHDTLVGIIGRIVGGKGHKEFILAAKEVIKQRPDIKFIIVGDAPSGNRDYYNQVNDLVGTQDIKENIIFTGWRDDIRNVVQDLNILVFASTFPEGLPNAIIEAMALKKPVIATDIPGPRDIVVNKKSGLLVPAGDVNAMAKEILYLCENPKICEEMGRQGRLIAEEKFDITKTVREIENIYNDILKGKKC